MGLRSKITDSFWFLPLAMGVLGIIFAWTMVWIDHFLINNAIDIKIADVGAEGGRGILTAIAGSILGVAATSFSITTSVLATASSTYGPRLVRNFMADSRNQFVLGSFVASFLYALMVLRTVRDVGDIGTAFVPNLAISVAIIMAIVNVVLLIYFIHHIADSIQISTLVSRVRDDLIHCIDALYPLAKNDDDDNIPRDRFTEELPNEPPIVVHSQSDGFITWIDYEKLVSALKEILESDRAGMTDIEKDARESDGAVRADGDYWEKVSDGFIKLLENIYKASDDFDMDSVEEKMHVLQNYRLPEALNEDMDGLKRAVNDIDYDEIKSYADRLMSEAENTSADRRHE